MKNRKESLRHGSFIKRIHIKKQEYIKTSTIHGVPKMFTGSRVESCFWLCVVLVGVTLSSYGAWRLISKYYRYEIYTSVSSRITNRNVFPSVTFCDEKLMFQNYYTYCGVVFIKNAVYPNKSCDSDPIPIPEIKNVVKSTGAWSNGMFNIIRCLSWDNKDCANDRHFKSLGKHHHMCITWNWNGDFFDAYGHTQIYFKLNKTAGYNFSKIIAVVHDPNVTELETMFRTYMEQSKIYQLKIRKTEIKRLPYPFPSNCTNEHPYDIFPGKYSRSSCMDSINYMDQLKECGDTFDYIKRYIPKHILRLYKRNVSMAAAWECMRNFAKRNDNSTDRCPVPCHEIELYTLSTFHESSEDETRYQVEIQHDKFDSYKVIQEKQLYTWDQIAGEVGGFLGLIIGVSFVSVVELLAYFSLLVLEKCSSVYY